MTGGGGLLGAGCRGVARSEVEDTVNETPSDGTWHCAVLISGNTLSLPCDNIGYTQLRCLLVAHTAILARQDVTGVTGVRGIIQLKQSEACFR